MIRNYLLGNTFGFLSKAVFRPDVNVESTLRLLIVKDSTIRSQPYGIHRPPVRYFSFLLKAWHINSGRQCQAKGKTHLRWLHLLTSNEEKVRR